MADKPNETESEADAGSKTQKPPEKAKPAAADTTKKATAPKPPSRTTGRTKLPPKDTTDNAGKADKAVVPTPKPKADRKSRDKDAKADKDAKDSKDDKDSTDGKPKKLPPKSKVESGRVTPKGGHRPAKTKISSMSGPEASSRYTPPTPHFDEMPSPLWVPILMFTMFGLGMLVIFLNYVELLPGATSNWYLLVGLGLILGGIITATQYR